MVLQRMAIRPFDEEDKTAYQTAHWPTVRDVAGRDDRGSEPGNKGVEQLSHGGATECQEVPEAQRICPRTDANFPEAEVQ